MCLPVVGRCEKHEGKNAMEGAKDGALGHSRTEHYGEPRWDGWLAAKLCLRLQVGLLDGLAVGMIPGRGCVGLCWCPKEAMERSLRVSRWPLEEGEGLTALPVHPGVVVHESQRGARKGGAKRGIPGGRIRESQNPRIPEPQDGMAR